MAEVFHGYELPIKLYRDGDQWCALLGENIQEGICGFGDTLEGAIADFVANLPC